MAERYRAVARVQKAHSNKGKVVVAPLRGLPSLLSAHMDVAIVPPELKMPRYFEVGEVEVGPSGDLVSFVGVRTRGDAETLVGKTILVKEDLLPEDFAFLDAEDLLGREVCDPARGFSATIAEIMRGPANDVWVLSGDAGEVLVPVIESVVEEIPETGSITVHIPDGLIGGE